LICLDENIRIESGFRLDQCQHTFCLRCLVTYINTSLNVTKLKCPVLDCQSILSEASVEKILSGDKSSYERYTGKLGKLCLDEASETEAFGDLVKEGQVMKCPQCGIYLERADSGCQMIRCFFCRLDICWLTKQARWGPAGKGDISAGCRCGVNGLKCHSDCKNCH